MSIINTTLSTLNDLFTHQTNANQLLRRTFYHNGRWNAKIYSDLRSTVQVSQNSIPELHQYTHTQRETYLFMLVSECFRDNSSLTTAAPHIYMDGIPPSFTLKNTSNGRHGNSWSRIMIIPKREQTPSFQDRREIAAFACLLRHDHQRQIPVTGARIV